MKLVNGKNKIELGKLNPSTTLRTSADLYNQSLEKIGKVELNPKIFGIDFNSDLVHQAVVSQEANAILTLAHSRDRSEVSGGGKKPWKQKGTGRSRQGSIRSPLWKGGGVTFGPRKEQNFSKKINKKMKRKAIFCVLSKKLFDGEIKFIDNIQVVSQKTKEAAKILATLKNGAASSALLILSKKDIMISRILRNVPKTKNILADSLNVVDLLKYKNIFILKESLPVIEKTYLK